MREYTDTERLDWLCEHVGMTRVEIDRLINEDAHGVPTPPDIRDGELFCWWCSARLSKHYPPQCPECGANLKREARP